MASSRIRLAVNRYSLRARLLFLSATLLAVGLLTNGLFVINALDGYLMKQADSRLGITTQICARLPATTLEPLQGQPFPSQWNQFSGLVVLYADDRGKPWTRSARRRRRPAAAPICRFSTPTPSSRARANRSPSTPRTARGGGGPSLCLTGRPTASPTPTNGPAM